MWLAYVFILLITFASAMKKSTISKFSIVDLAQEFHLTSFQRPTAQHTQNFALISALLANREQTTSSSSNPSAPKAALDFKSSEQTIALAKAQYQELQNTRDREFHQQALTQYAQANSLVSLNHHVRSQGDCGADSIAVLINGPDLTAAEFGSQRAIISQGQRLYLANWLMANENTILPGMSGLTFGNLPRYAPSTNPLETWAEFCTRMKLNAEYLQAPVFAAAAFLFNVRIDIVASAVRYQPNSLTFHSSSTFTDTYMPAGAAPPTRTLTIALQNTAAGPHFFPLAKQEVFAVREAGSVAPTASPASTTLGYQQPELAIAQPDLRRTLHPWLPSTAIKDHIAAYVLNRNLHTISNWVTPLLSYHIHVHARPGGSIHCCDPVGHCSAHERCNKCFRENLGAYSV